MSNSVESSLLQVATSTFEDLGFLLAERTLSERQSAAEWAAAASVAFDGSLRGRVEVRIFGEVLPTLAMNMLGEDALPSPALQRDALGEVANVICGNLVPALAGSREIFRLSAPVEVDRDPAVAPAASAVVGLEQGRAEVLLFTESPRVEGGRA